jgi:hypothetical protein
MALVNPRFEDAGAAPGLAAMWTLTTVVAAERLAGFGPDPARAVEDFERWFDLQLGFATAGGDVVFAVFAPLQTGFEAFERGWANDVFLTHFPDGNSVVCGFGQGPTEDLESGWNTTPWFTTWNDVLDIVGFFDNLPVEDFAQHWSGNENSVFAFDLLPAAPARFDLGAVSAELFEGVWTLATTL